MDSFLRRRNSMNENVKERWNNVHRVVGAAGNG